MIVREGTEYIALTEAGFDEKRGTGFRDRDAAVREALLRFSERLHRLEMQASAAADLFAAYTRGDFGDGDQHERFIASMLVEVANLAARLACDDPAWSLTHDAAEVSPFRWVVTMPDGQTLESQSQADEYLDARHRADIKHDRQVRHDELERAAAADPAVIAKRQDAARRMLDAAADAADLPPRVERAIRSATKAHSKASARKASR